MNTSQDPDYEGPTGHEVKFHKTHFQFHKSWKGTHPKDDPDWEYVGAGRWKRVYPHRNAKSRREGAEENDEKDD